MRGRVPRVVALAVALVMVAGCGSGGGDADREGASVADAQPVLDAGLVDREGLARTTSLTWEEADDLGDDTDLPACEELTTVGTGALEDVQAEEGSATFTADLPGGSTTTSAIIRDSVLVYGDEEAAAAALAEVDAGLLRACIAPSIPDGAVDEVEVVDEPAPQVGDEAVALSTELDDSVFFGGNDNAHRTDLVVARTGPVLVAVQIIASSQSFDGVDVAGVADAVVDRAVARVGEAQ